jgi:hypothetical protein
MAIEIPRILSNPYRLSYLVAPNAVFVFAIVTFQLPLYRAVEMTLSLSSPFRI